MPASTRGTRGVDAVVEADAQFDVMKMDREEDLGRHAPEAREPLSPSNVNTLSETLARTMDAITDGQGPELAIPPVQEPQPRLPAAVFAPLVAVFGLMSELAPTVPEVTDYVVDPLELAETNDGLLEAAGVLSAMADDEKLRRAMARPMSAPASPGRPMPTEKSKPPAEGAGEPDMMSDAMARRKRA
jgi:hypothetical protein